MNPAEQEDSCWVAQGWRRTERGREGCNGVVENRKGCNGWGRMGGSVMDAEGRKGVDQDWEGAG